MRVVTVVGRVPGVRSWLVDDRSRDRLLGRGADEGFAADEKHEVGCCLV